MMRTLTDWLDAGGEWPEGLALVNRNSHRSARCTCGRVSGTDNFVDVDPPEVPAAQRLSAELRRSRVRTRFQEEEEASPRWVCGWCFGAIRVGAGLTREQIRDKVGHR